MLKNHVYKPYLISTVVDGIRRNDGTCVYKPYLISTVVDIVYMPTLRRL